MPSIARLTPHGFHQYVYRVRGRAEVDTFPARYRANTRRDVSRLVIEAGMLIDKLELIEGRPECLRMTWPSYLIGAAYEYLVNASEVFAPLRIRLIGASRKAVSELSDGGFGRSGLANELSTPGERRAGFREDSRRIMKPTSLLLDRFFVR